MCGILFWRSGFLLKALQRSLGFLFFFFFAAALRIDIPAFISARLDSSALTQDAIYGADKKGFLLSGRYRVSAAESLLTRSFPTLSPLSGGRSRPDRSAESALGPQVCQ